MEVQYQHLALHPIEAYQIPSHVQDGLLKRTRLYVARDTPLLGLEDLSLHTVDHDNGDVSYLGEHDKIYLNGQVESNTHVVDVNKDLAITGIAEIRFAADRDDDYFKGKPFVGWTQTLEGFEGKDLGRRRALVMNAASIATYCLVLNSGTLRSHPAVARIWDRLVQEGLAEIYKEAEGKTGESTERYRFVN